MIYVNQYKILAIFLALLLSGILDTASVFAQDKSAAIDPAFPFKRCWSYPALTTETDIASDNEGTIIYHNSNEILQALDTYSGKKLWDTKLGGKIISSPVFDKDKNSFFIATVNSVKRNLEIPADTNKTVETIKNGLDSGENQNIIIKISSLDKNTGVTNWQTSLSPKLNAENIENLEDFEQQLSIFIYADRIIAAEKNGDITALNQFSGEILWKKVKYPKLSDAYFVQEGENLFAFAGKNLILINLETGKYIFQKKTDSVSTAAFFLYQAKIILGDSNGEITAFDKQTDRIKWKVRTGAKISNITFTPKGLLITSFDNFVYLVEPKSGKIIWKTRLENRVVTEPVLFGEYLFVSTIGSVKTNILNLSKGLPVNQIYLQTGSYFLSLPLFNKHLVIFLTTEGISAFANSNKECFRK